MNIIFTQEVRKNICTEVLGMQQTTSLKISDVIKRVAEKYNIIPTRIYEWNKQFNYIFKTSLFTDDDKIYILKEILNLLTENKNILVKDVLLQIANKYGLTSGELYYWNRKFNIFPTQKKYSEKDMIFILNKIKQQAYNKDLHEVVLEFAYKLEVSENTIYYWNRKYNIFQTKRRYNFDFK